MVCLSEVIIVCAILVAGSEHVDCGKNYVFQQNCSCGVENAVRSRILGGEETKPAHRFPWMVALVDEEEKLVGGGSVIGSQHVLTAAHCCTEQKEQKLRAVLGGHRISSTPLPVTVKECRVHPDYRGVAYVHDIAVLVLSEPIVFHDFVSPLCIETNDTSLEGKPLFTVIGWGRVTEVSQTSDVLKLAQLPFMSLEACREKLGEDILDNNLCAGGSKEDTCQGDSGGPLMLKRGDGRWLQVGVVSWGIGCGRLGFPGIYTRVSRYSEFIWNVTGGTLCRESDDTRNLQLENAVRPLKRPNLPSCGVANRYGQGRIVGGSQVFANKFPWLAAIMYRGNLSGAGAYIGNGYVLTAAGVVGSEAVGHPERLRVLLGAHDLSRPQKQSAAHAVVRVLVHPGYSHPYFDAALLRLAREEGKDPARPLCLPSSGDHYPPGSKTLVAGWGRVHTYGPLSSTPNEVYLNVVPRSACSHHFKDRSVEGLICATNKGRDICDGDAGGPLMQFFAGRYYAAGLASSGKAGGCAQDGVPAVFTKVGVLLKWIHAETGLQTA